MVQWRRQAQSFGVGRLYDLEPGGSTFAKACRLVTRTPELILMHMDSRIRKG